MYVLLLILVITSSGYLCVCRHFLVVGFDAWSVSPGFDVVNQVALDLIIMTRLQSSTRGTSVITTPKQTRRTQRNTPLRGISPPSDAFAYRWYPRSIVTIAATVSVFTVRICLHIKRWRDMRVITEQRWSVKMLVKRWLSVFYYLRSRMQVRETRPSIDASFVSQTQLFVLDFFVPAFERIGNAWYRLSVS